MERGKPQYLVQYCGISSFWAEKKVLVVFQRFVGMSLIFFYIKTLGTHVRGELTLKLRRVPFFDGSAALLLATV